MKHYFVVLCVIWSVCNALYSDEASEVEETCCSHGQSFALKASSANECAAANTPEDTDPSQLGVCKTAIANCCQEYFKNKDECSAGLKFAPQKRCNVPKTEIGKTCCEECSFGRWSGESQGRESCGSIAEDDVSPTSALRSYAYVTCCVEAAEKPETTTEKKAEITTTTEKKVETTTEKKVETTTILKPVMETCKKNSCEHLCNDDDGKVRCSCHEGFRLQADKKSCKDINECAEAIDDLCTAEGTVCHNTAGSFKCVPIRKREVPTLTCPPGFKRNVQNQVCDDINECQLPRPPCPKYLCENTIGGYKCSGKPGKPFQEIPPGAPTELPSIVPESSKNDICPSGFRAGPDDECMDIDECVERLDDCQRLSQHCINTHGGFFCQDHVSKRCAPGFKVNVATGICEDIDECEESSEVCKRSEVCINLPGAYNCKSKISTLPKLASKTCQEGMRLTPGMTICEDIDECREGTHLCDQFQNCINTYGSHECRCKKGYELDSTSGSCSDIDECALKLDNCPSELHCINTLGGFTCSKRVPTTSTTPPPLSEDYYYDSEEDNSTNDYDSPLEPPRPSNTPSRKPTTTSTPARPVYPTYPTYPSYITPRTITSTTHRTLYTNTPLNTRPNSPTTSTEATTTPKTAETDISTNEIIVPTPPRVHQPTSNFTRRPDTPTRPVIPTRPDTSARPDNPSRPVTGTRPDTPTRPDDTQTRPIRPSGPTERPRRPIYPITTPTATPTTISITTTEKTESNFDLTNHHCLNGYEHDARGYCVDVNECETNRYICRNLEKCVNMEGGYRCNCVAGFERDLSGWCRPSVFTNTTPRISTVRTTTARPTTTSTTTEITTTEVVTTPRLRQPPLRPHEVPISCELGYKYDSNQRRCIDINECENKNTCASNEDCHNVDGGYYCHCGARCRAASERPHEPPQNPREPYPPAARESPDDNIITVGAQFGHRGPRYMRPTFSRIPNIGSISTSCPWGYSLTSDRICVDIDECAKNVSQCGPGQRCENFFGGYSCQCPSGHKLYGKDGCQDIDECFYGSPCSYNSKCVNTVGSYRCECGEGFRNSPSNDKVCVDVDECAETPSVCHQNCANAWGGYRCYCKRGYRLENDNRTCVDVDECTEWSAVRTRARLCGGTCVNEPGSYRCACPAGYRLAEDGKSCIDINECETGEATCASSTDPGYVCQNTRGSYHCHHIDCPAGYRLEGKHRCTRVQRSCPVTDWGCLQQPSAYSYNFITFVANIFLPTGSVDLFTMRGPSWSDSVVSFELRMVNVQAGVGVNPADLRCFDMRPTDNVCVISLLCSLGGPQVAELELTMSLYQRGQFAGNAVARLIIIVSQYEF